MSLVAVVRLFVHEWQIFFRSPSLWVMIGLPIPLSYFVVKAQPPGTPLAAAVPMWILFSQVMIGILGMSLSLVEEREKRTVQALLVSFASYWDVVVAKYAFFSLVSIGVQALVITLNGAWSGGVAALLGAALVGGLVFTLCGIAVGLMTESVKSGSAAGSALMVVLFLTGSLFSAFGPAQPVLRWLPNVSGIRLAEQALAGAAWGGRDLAVSAGWAVLLIVVVGWRIRAELSR